MLESHARQAELHGRKVEGLVGHGCDARGGEVERLVAHIVGTNLWYVVGDRHLLDCVLLAS